MKETRNRLREIIDNYGPGPVGSWLSLYECLYLDPDRIVREDDTLNESATTFQVKDAINKKYKVWIWYYEKGTDGSKKRLICPVAYGISKGGNPVVRAFQDNGSTRSTSPEWKMFRLDRIRIWEPTRPKQHFKEPPTYGSGVVGKPYNPKGDKGMSRCLLNAKFEDSEGGTFPKRTRQQMQQTQNGTPDASLVQQTETPIEERP